ncbi:MAG: Kdo hydroxylase family protein [Verrucomicrobiota bacterium]|jgi:hypothetical protein
MSTTHQDPPGSAAPRPATADVLRRVDDYRHPEGWTDAGQALTRARQCCEELEEGRILYFERSPFDLAKGDQEFLLTLRKAGSRKESRVSYHPLEGPLAGTVASKSAGRHAHGILRHYSSEVTRSVGWLLAPYAMDWTLDHACLRLRPDKAGAPRPGERNDLLHVDAYSTRPTRGRRLLRCFTNIHLEEPVLWAVAESFEALAQRFAEAAGLSRLAAKGSPRTHPLARELKMMLGMKAVDLSAYDRFMVRFERHLKEEQDWQEKSRKIRLEFPPGSSWICLTDAVPHAELSAGGTLEQGFTVPLRVLVRPERAPIRVLEAMAGMPLANY